ncbi:unnamed protein product [Somion occarium]|uniref:Uncharacterized protein n=1 Tax=Somion occarium TaxID=3059160 RepID=A0ABP1D5D4_9APHY
MVGTAQQQFGLTLGALHTSSKVDKDELIRAYLQFQRTFRASHIAEGRAVQAAWETPPRVEISSKPTELHSNGSPLLKARVPLPAKPKTLDEAVEARPNGEKAKKKKGSNTKKTKKAKRTSPPRAASNKKYKQTKIEHFTNIREKEKPTCAQTNSKKRARSPDSDGDARLTQRRERRRVKRAILQPSPPSSDIVHSDQHETIDMKQNQKRAKIKPSKKPKGGDLAAGLALMHGFSAPNIGSGRLTVKPSSGLFHKGKALSPSRSKKSNNTKLLWSEAKFLNKKAQTQQCSTTSSVSVSDAKSNSITSGSSSTYSERSPKSIVKARKVKARNASHRPGCRGTQESSELSSMAPEIITDDSTKAREAESVVWDIELGDNALDVESTVSQSMVVDTRTRKWTAQESYPNAATLPAEPLLVSSPTGPDDPQPESQSSVSLRPSQSASQVLFAEYPKPAPIDVSKYFRNSPAEVDSQPTEAKRVHVDNDEDSPVDSIEDESPALQEQRSTVEIGELPYRSELISPQPSSVQTVCSFDRELQSIAGLHLHLFAGSSEAYPEVEIIHENTSNAELSEGEDGGMDDASIWVHESFSLRPNLHSGPTLSEDEAMSLDTAFHNSCEGACYDSDEFAVLSPDDASVYSDSQTDTTRHPNMYDDEHNLRGMPFNNAMESASAPLQSHDPGSEEYAAHSASIIEDDEGYLFDLCEGETRDDIISVSGERVAEISWSTSSNPASEEDSTEFEEQSAPSELQYFSQGRALLLGITSDSFDCEGPSSNRPQALSHVERNIARQLKGHWLPQRL